ncbi:MAG: serine--tRNA ligase [Crocinitomicaceae bacterium]|nr:serine--tRNA ligase [Crocinitomicaceae bacterium]|tara:strand:+ start:17414 stop:18682 length:1269 start_codon:yes stop_codon:yes gene_type:complete
MLLISNIRENHEEIVQRMKLRNVDVEHVVEKILAVDKRKREVQKRYEDNQHAIHISSKEIGDLFKAGNKEEGNALREKAGSLKEDNKLLHEEVNRLDEELLELMYQIPNVPHESIAPGKDDSDNVEISKWGEKPNLSQNKEHWVLAREYGIIDWELGVKITGAGFPVYRGKGAKLQRALVQFFLDEAEDHGYEEINPPFLINEASGYGTGQLPDKDGQMYHTERDHLYLIPTAEVPITNIYRDTIIKEADFPLKNVAFSPCFRREAGSYGKDVRGLNRLHQFEKVEIVQIVHPNKSFEILEEMVTHVKGLLEKLGLHYRVVRLCGGDLGFASALTYDFEVWSAAQERWLEVSSVSNFASFQANRMKCRFKDSNGKTQLVHTLNGSAMALPRIMAAIIENYQTEEGIVIPECIQKYLKFDILN